jgi:hypothetical protein
LLLVVTPIDVVMTAVGLTPPLSATPAAPLWPHASAALRTSSVTPACRSDVS